MVRQALPAGMLSLVLHAHLPFVRHPEHADMMEERWLFEAITETYIPLLRAFERLVSDGVKFRLTMSVTPPLANMLDDELLAQRYKKYLGNLIQLAEKEVIRTHWMPEFHASALLYRQKFSEALAFFEKWDCRLLQAFSFLQKSGVLEIITCCATHGYLPLMRNQPESIRAQIEMAVIDYQAKFACAPKGIWLAECAFCPGDDRFLQEMGIKYFFTDTHGILYAQPRPSYGVYAPVQCPSAVAAFARDVESSRQVWSSHEGYPGDYYYREFYRDIGFDLDVEYLRPFMHETGIRLNTGIKYHRITSRDNPSKEPYNYAKAMERVAIHAAHFINSREKQVKYLAKVIDRQPIVVSPYDAELFGHWWYEGPEFIHQVLRKIALESEVIKLATPSDYLQEYPTNQVAMPSESSWGHHGYNEFWLNETNDWIYPHAHKAAERMVELAEKFPDAFGQMRRALNQAARELMLLQSSDWAFIMKTNTTVKYATKRVKDHIFRFNKLYEDILSGKINEKWLRAVEERDNIFPQMNYRIYSRLGGIEE
jgi:1,4-alpha-glucan branching enzyme